MGLRTSGSFGHVVSSSTRWLATKAAGAIGGAEAGLLLNYLLERDMLRHRFPFLAGEDTPQTTLSHP